MWSQLWQKISSVVWSNFGLNKDDKWIVIRDRLFKTARVKEKSTVKLGWLASWFFHGSSNGFFKIIYFNIFSFKKYFTYFNWRLITLQYCGAFCHTLTWISHGCTWVSLSRTFLTLPSYPILWVFPEHWLWVPCFSLNFLWEYCGSELSTDMRWARNLRRK